MRRYRFQPSGRFPVLLRLALRLMLAAVLSLAALVQGTFPRSATAAPGDLDPSFGSGGAVITPLPGDNHLSALLLQPDGNIVAVGTTQVSIPEGPQLSDLLLVRYTASGALDPSFGNGGGVSTDFGGTREAAATATLTPDGKIVVAGFSCPPPLCTLALARYHGNGALDSSFGNGGIAVYPGPISNGSALALLPDGRLVVGGYAGGNFGLTRLNSDGTLDLTFGTDGWVFTDFDGGEDVLSRLALQPDGKILAAGKAGVHASGYLYFDDLALARYTADGVLDASFGDGGKVTTDLRGHHDAAHALALQPDGKIVLAGSSSVLLGGADLAMARYRENGAIDAGFGTGGMVIQDGGSLSEGLHSLVIQPDGRILAGGSMFGNVGWNVLLARFDAAGNPDLTFGNNGLLATDLFGTHEEVAALALQPDGKLLAGGNTHAGGQGANFMVLRYATSNAAGGLEARISAQSGAVFLSWIPGSGEAGYLIVRYTDGSDVGVALPATGPLPAGTKSFTDTAIGGGTTHCYVILALGGAGVVGRSGVVCSGPASSGPAPVTQFALRLTAPAIASLTWDPVQGKVQQLILFALPLDGSPPRLTSLPLQAANALDGTGGIPTCYAVGTLAETAWSITNVLCAMPGTAGMD